MRRASLLLLTFLGACGTKGPESRPQRDGPPFTLPREEKKPEPYVPAADPSAVTHRFVRAERSSRLAAALPPGKPHGAFTAALDPGTEPIAIFATGTRVVVHGKRRFAIFDTKGVRVGTGPSTDAPAWLVPADGAYRVDGPNGATSRGLESAQPMASLTPSSGRELATHDGITVSLETGSIAIGDRTISTGGVEAVDAAIDDEAVAHVLVRQAHELSLWTTPLAGGSIGRTKIPSMPGERTIAPPIAGKQLRAVAFGDRIVGLARDGKVVFARHGRIAGATITEDDKLLVADGKSVVAIDSGGHATELVTGAAFVTAPVLSAKGLLLVASATALHAYAF